MIVRYWLKQIPAPVVKNVYHVNFNKDGMLVIGYRFEGFNKQLVLRKAVDYDLLTIIVD